MSNQTRQVNVQDIEFLRWSESIRRGGNIGDQSIDQQAQFGRRMVQLRPLDPRDPDIDPPESPPENPRPPRTDPPISNFHAYENRRLDVDWNTCGQAAIASMLDYLGRDPFGLPRVRRGKDGRMHWDDGAVIDALINAGFGPDVAFGFGTTGGRIRDALFAYGCNQAYEEHSGLFSAGWQGLWERLKVFLRDLKTPVPVLVDLGALGGSYYTAHWAIAHRVTAAEEVHLAACPWRPVVDRQTFLHAWHCSFLPLGFNHCAVWYSRQWE